MERINTISWKFIDKYFENDHLALINHHISSYNDFFTDSSISNKNIQRIFRDTNPIKIRKNMNKELGDYEYQIDLYIGGKNGSNINYSLPTINERDNIHYMYPNEARLKDMTYSVGISYDILVEIKELKMSDNNEKEILTDEIIYNNVFLGKFPLMINSKFCLLKDLSRNVKFNMGECRNDKGGYFIVDGKEKSFIPQETFANNMVNITRNLVDNI